MGVLAVILGIIALLCALLGTFLFGTTGMIIAAALAAAACVLAFVKRKKDGKGGIAGIVIAVLSIVLAFSMNNTWSTAFKELHKKALEYKADSLWAQASEDTSGGIMGIISKLPRDEASIDALMKEMEDLNKLAGK